MRVHTVHLCMILTCPSVPLILFTCQYRSEWTFHVTCGFHQAVNTWSLTSASFMPQSFVWNPFYSMVARKGFSHTGCRSKIERNSTLDRVLRPVQDGYTATAELKNHSSMGSLQRSRLACSGTARHFGRYSESYCKSTQYQDAIYCIYESRANLLITATEYSGL